jgi:MFS transporter, putative metabolite:H+ symporter
MKPAAGSGKAVGLFSIAVIAASLGYFVDIYDLVLFNVVKRESLQSIMGSNHPDIKSTGIFLFNMQMTGMLIGGILWGILGDKKGRLRVMFGSILLYSVANIANAFVTDITTYAVIRVIAGIGLAGELGAGITLVSETMDKEKRGYGTMLIVTFGALGAVLASIVGLYGDGLAHSISGLFGGAIVKWQVAYLIGGVLGLMLLLLRFSAFESGMFENLAKTDVVKGNFFMLFREGRFPKYLACILVGLPIWYVIGVLVALAQDVFGNELKVAGTVQNGYAVMFAYIGLSAGDLLSGILSQVLRSRKKVVYLYLVFTLVLVVWYLYFSTGISLSGYYFLCFLLGAATGYWAIFVTIASEQFGTNIRSTVTNTVPNFVRGAVLPITMSFTALIGPFGTLNSALVVGLVCLGLAFVATLSLKETFGKDLDYVE